jgi:hypothetical protein
VAAAPLWQQQGPSARPRAAVAAGGGGRGPAAAARGPASSGRGGRGCHACRAAEATRAMACAVSGEETRAGNAPPRAVQAQPVWSCAPPRLLLPPLLLLLLLS